MQLASLGYLLEVSGRIARTGRVSAGFFGMRKAARAGSVALGIGLTLVPLLAIAWWVVGLSSLPDCAEQAVALRARRYGR